MIPFHVQRHMGQTTTHFMFLSVPNGSSIGSCHLTTEI